MFKTNTQLREQIGALETRIAELENELQTGASDFESLKGERDTLAQSLQESNERAANLASELEAAQALLTEAETQVETANEQSANVASAVNTAATQIVATIGAETVPSASAEETPDVVAQWRAMPSGQARIDFFKLHAAAIKKACGMG